MRQWAWGTYVEINLGKKAIITHVQITNKVDEKDDDSNYKTVKLTFSNGYEEEVNLNNGKKNDKHALKYPVETTLVRVTGVSTWGVTNDQTWLPKNTYTGWRSGMSEIRLFGCEGMKKQHSEVLRNNLSNMFIQFLFALNLR